MKAPNISPGPWKAREVQGNASILRRHYRLAQGEGNMPLAYMPVCLLSDGGPDANAQAIAALPECLKALEDVLACPMAAGALAHAGKLDLVKAALVKAGYTE